MTENEFDELYSPCSNANCGTTKKCIVTVSAPRMFNGPLWPQKC